jgi:hypothetical protein
MTPAQQTETMKAMMTSRRDQMTCVRSMAMPVGVDKAHRHPGMIPHLDDSSS